MKGFLALLFFCSLPFAKAEDSRLTMQHVMELLEMLTSQITMQQFHFQERIRSEGNSGIKQIRIRQSGVNNYNTETHAGGSLAAIHTHSNAIRTVGLGEFIGVLNGVEFRTRHNDYRMVMPSETSGNLHDVQNVPFPDVPREVLGKATVKEQIDEMREFFQAWRDQNSSHRNYNEYFKPVLCYLEGGWFKVKPGGEIQESFRSDRHSLDASKWTQLHNRAQFMAFSGAKSRLENLAVLPTAFMGTINNTIIPQLAQFNYRILCHPLKTDLPTKYLHIVEDFSNRLFRNRKKSMMMQEMSRAARFQLNARRSKDIGGQYHNGLLDELMSEIPGKDNYRGEILSKEEDDDTVLSANGTGLMNLAFYNRYYRMRGKDAMGLNMVHRSYSDDFAFAARTSQPLIAGLDYSGKCAVQSCKKGTEGCNANSRKLVCPPSKHEKWTWAIPLEIIYLTPLHSWNPYDIVYQNSSTDVTNGQRTGDCSSDDKAYNGSSSKLYFRTPAEFFENDRGQLNAADTVKGAVCVLNDKGERVRVKASGIYIHLPEIKGLGQLRVRYPIMPVHGEGSSAWKELNALRQLVMNRELMTPLIYNGPDEKAGYKLELQKSRTTPQHTHEVTLSPHEWKLLAGRKTITVTTSHVNGHDHKLEIMQRGPDRFFYKTCDGNRVCSDRHSKLLKLKKID